MKFEDIPLFNSLYSNTVAPKDVYYFCSNKINSTEPHYFICICTHENVLMFACTTTQYEKRLRYIESKNLNKNTLVTIPIKDSNVSFTRNSYVDCNSYQEFTIEEFRKLCTNNDFEHKGTLENIHFQNIVNGLCLSEEIDEEFKEIIRKSIN
jgi:hypothetical protein